MRDGGLPEFDYLTRRLAEARAIEADAAAKVAELEACLHGAPPIDDLRFAEWVERRRMELEHIDVELFVLAFTPAPPVWLVMWAEPVPWWRVVWRW